MCLNFGINTDEYDPEACSLVAKLNYGITKCEVANAVAEVISYYFSQDFSMYTHDKKWKTMAQRIWAAWAAYQEKSPSDDK
jgi:hypothetical protein